jgi:hypothetical protein
MPTGPRSQVSDRQQAGRAQTAQVRSSWHRHRLDGVVRWAQAALRLDNPTAVIAVLH